MVGSKANDDLVEYITLSSRFLETKRTTKEKKMVYNSTDDAPKHFSRIYINSVDNNILYNN